MGILGETVREAARDLDYTRPRVIVTDQMAVLENVAAIVMLTENQVTVSHGLKLYGHGSRLAEKRGGQWFTTISGTGLVIKEISEGRLLIGGKIGKAEFLQSQGAD